MDRDGLIIGFGGLVLSVLTYFAGVIRTERRYARTDRAVRITRVLDAYLDAAHSGRVNGFPGLLRAGVATLKNDAEIRELLDHIYQHDQRWDPRPTLQDIDTHKFFTTAVERHIDFMASGNEERLVAELRKKDD